MALFPVINVEDVVQSLDKTRIDASKSFKTQDHAAITQVRIRASSTDPWVIVASGANAENSKLWYLDWVYSTTGSKTCEVEFTAGSVETGTGLIVVVSAASENLFSKDTDLIAEEPDVLKYIKAGRASFIDLHRRAQKQILDTIYKSRIFNEDETKVTAAEVLDVEEIRLWSRYLVLKYIFTGISNVPGDIFESKRNYYAGLEHQNMQLAMNVLKLDFNKNDELENSERIDNRTISVVRG